MRRPVATAVVVALTLALGGAGLGVHLASSLSDSAPDAAGDAVGQTVFDSAQQTNPVVASVDSGDDEPNEGDLMFADMMVPHHEQAIELARILAATPQIDEFSSTLAAFIERDQAREIEQMSSWSQAWRDAGVSGHGQHGTMAGMATPEQIAQFDSLEGEAAETMFLELMIAHHEGALVMAQEVLSTGSNSFIRTLAKHIAAEQEREIEAMRLRLEAL